ncbi:hypothetical protein COEREDRAFT_83790 [Coemansia reversa NRRL 1564]|uniref:RGS domain-containing protein n=1 Tax=Coemansia reversa (strain ATCC 12441 / NRRL 1564) TaxID=763665 RepID=A0A2G5B1R6_COERN|nr:hypothetical protein COEREDRAFT_83790 [Coemansia reversa NRRL 1564]|eukprot:PIA12958.1 hypothetical protein COEREDRAFT_83790 [Coemansia reversa NRRL 1564]
MNNKNPLAFHDSGIRSEQHIPLPGQQPDRVIDSSPDQTRSRSESDGLRTISARSSDERAPLSTFFENQAWQRMSTVLPAAVRDPLNIDELEREERLMPYTEVAVGEMGTSGLRVNPHMRSETGDAAMRQLTMQRASAMTSDHMAINRGDPIDSEKSVVGGTTGGHAIDWAYMQDHNLRTGGLPSLDQVLTRRTRAPLALRDFAVHCSVRQPQARRWLEFYMAARTHEKMCMAYESDLRHAKARSHYASGDSSALPPKSHRNSTHPFGDDSHEITNSVRRTAAHNATIESLSRGKPDDLLHPDDDLVQPLDDLQGNNPEFRRSRRQSTRMALQIQTAAETIFMRYFRAALDPNLNRGVGGFWQSSALGAGPSPAAAIGLAHAQSGNSPGNNRGKIGSLKRMLTQKPSSSASRGLGRLQPTLDDPYHQGYGVAATNSVYAGNNSEDYPSGGNSMYDNVQGQLGSTASLTMSREYLSTPITGNKISNGNAGTQRNPHYLQMNQGTSRGLGGAFGSSRHHIYYHMPWPPEILTNIEQRLLHDGAALDHALFSEALLYAYDVLDTYYFPIFIADAVSRNVTRDHCALRVFIAFAFLWFGFALPLALILLDHEPKAHRVWCIIPQLIGWWNMAVGFGGCDSLLAIMRKYQSPIMKDVGALGAATAAANGPSVGSKTQKQKWSFRRKLDDWHRAWFSTRISVDMTATRMVRARSIRWFIGALVMTAISSAILCAVPGTRIFED